MESQKRWLTLYPEHIAKEVEIPVKSIPQLLKDTTKKFPEQTALTFFDEQITYQGLYNTVEKFASALQQHEIKKGDRVALMLPNCPQYVIAYYGTLRAGGIVTQVNPMLVERELAYLINDSGAETIVVYEALLPRVMAVQSEINLKNIIVVPVDHTSSQADAGVTFTEFLSTGNVTAQTTLIDPEEDVAVLQYTGGTTGRSKGAMLTHRNLLANLTQTYEFFKDDLKVGKEKILTVIPMFHVFGMSSCMNLAVYTGSTSIILPRFELEEVLETIKREQPTIFPGVPTMYVAITNHPDAEKYQIDSIRTCNSGSAPMPVELLKEFEQKTGATLLEGYGLSETAPTTHVNPIFAERKPGSVGIGVPSTDYRIVDIGSGETDVPTGELGEVVIRGPQVMKGYWNMPEETAHTLRDGWLYTGDIGKVDEDGYLYIVDRKKDLIIASGYNIYPRDVEEVLYEHPAVKEAVVIGVPDRYRGETVKAILVLKDGQSANVDELKSYCGQHLAAYKVPKMIEFRDELPKTSVGKILRRTLRDEVRNGNKGLS
ncbi:long-chain-fatty-acid--CoA ligase [Desertibacillus haloalkaliphilus]|uniref:long-chain-fatty-acid--CoA ligase n=1 Tax=Desertibacillus haloalkaliphilus TaxID=1328930 RepID=UPI001C278448|nr:long-chain fatty acid--CoA ligase [Desertibacillus haloalkaliphilus]MBU8905643.1 long-chain fatty acid--CoA ligase [Desertibacillus haloalkaliphilus]